MKFLFGSDVRSGDKTFVSSVFDGVASALESSGAAELHANLKTTDDPAVPLICAGEIV